MATWKVSDELDARVREHVGDDSAVSAFVEQLVQDQLEFGCDPAFRAEALAKIRRGRAEIESGQGVDAREAMQQIADKYGLDTPQ